MPIDNLAIRPNQILSLHLAIPIPRIIFCIKLSANLIARCRPNLKPRPSLITDGRDSKLNQDGTKYARVLREMCLRMRYNTPQSLRKHATSDDPLSNSGEEGEETPEHTKEILSDDSFFFLFVVLNPCNFSYFFPSRLSPSRKIRLLLKLVTFTVSPSFDNIVSLKYPRYNTGTRNDKRVNRRLVEKHFIATHLRKIEHRSTASTR